MERAIIGQEIECAVLGNSEPKASIPCEILPFKDFYDYEDKYLLDKTQFRIPPDLPDERVQEIRRLAVACFEAIGCQGMSRVDFLIERSSGQILHQRDKHHSRLYVHQHVSEDVGARRACVSEAP